MKLLREYIREAMETKSEPTRMPLNIPIPADLRKISGMFNTKGQELYIVGGAVRDALLNKTPKDYDLATGATPEAVIDIVSKDPGSKVDLTGKSFGVVRVWTSEGNEYEIATFRKDIGSGRRPDAVEFTSIEDDVKRRDLTINALFYDMNSGEVVDYVGGIEDIKSGVVKAVGDPIKRFQEDKLRILRAVRFAGRMGSDLDPETEAAIMADNDLTEVSPERTRDELIKGLTSSQDIRHFLGLLDKLDLFPQIFPNLQVNSSTGIPTNDVSVQLSLILGNNSPEQVRQVLKKMKYTNDEVDTVGFMLEFPDITRTSAPALKKEFIRIKMSPDQLQEFAKPFGIPQKTVDAFLAFAKAPPAANPRDLMAQGLIGPDIGIAMQSAESDAYGQMLGELREYIRGMILNETRFKQMSKSKFTDLQQHLANSSFLDANPEGDLDDDDDWASEAANVLRDDLNNYFDNKFGNGLLTAIVKVDMMNTKPDAGMDGAFKSATYYFENGLHFIEVMLASVEGGPTFRDVGNVSQKAYEVLLHELLHMQQFMKFSKGDPTNEKWDQFMEEYERRGGATGMKQDYFFFDQADGASELETFSLQIATELVNTLGKEAAVSLLQKQHPDYEMIRKNSSSFRNIEAKGNDISRPEFRELIKRAKQYAKR